MKKGVQILRNTQMGYQWDDVLVDTIFDCSIQFSPLNSLLIDYFNYFSVASPCFGTCNPYVRLCLMPPKKNKTNQRPDICKTGRGASPASVIHHMHGLRQQLVVGLVISSNFGQNLGTFGLDGLDAVCLTYHQWPF
jgi:hypothetical protein